MDAGKVHQVTSTKCQENFLSHSLRNAGIVYSWQLAGEAWTVACELAICSDG